jgi:hypothetical protein
MYTYIYFTHTFLQTHTHTHTHTHIHTHTHSEGPGALNGATATFVNQQHHRAWLRPRTNALNSNCAVCYPLEWCPLKFRWSLPWSRFAPKKKTSTSTRFCRRYKTAARRCTTQCSCGTHASVCPSFTPPQSDRHVLTGTKFTDTLREACTYRSTT